MTHPAYPCLPPFSSLIASITLLCVPITFGFITLSSTLASAECRSQIRTLSADFEHKMLLLIIVSISMNYCELIFNTTFSDDLEPYRINA